MKVGLNQDANSNAISLCAKVPPYLPGFETIPIELPANIRIPSNTESNIESNIEYNIEYIQPVININTNYLKEIKKIFQNEVKYFYCIKSFVAKNIQAYYYTQNGSFFYINNIMVSTFSNTDLLKIKNQITPTMYNIIINNKHFYNNIMKYLLN